MGGTNDSLLLGETGRPHFARGKDAAPGSALDFEEHHGVHFNENRIDFVLLPSPILRKELARRRGQFSNGEILGMPANPGAAFQNHGARMHRRFRGVSKDFVCVESGLMNVVATVPTIRYRSTKSPLPMTVEPSKISTM